MREYQVRICERLGVKFPGPTRQKRRFDLGPASSGLTLGTDIVRPPRSQRCQQATSFRLFDHLVHAQQELLRDPQTERSCRREKRTSSNQSRYSITSSARVNNVAGMTRLSVLAVLGLTANTNLIGCSIGRSLAFVPLKILAM